MQNLSEISHDKDIVTKDYVDGGLALKVNKVEGKGLSEESFTSLEKSKLSSISENANDYSHPNHSGDVTSMGDGATTIANNVVTDGKFRQSAALSLIGRASNSVGNISDIIADTDGFVLRRSGNTLGFGTVTTTGIADMAITNTKLANMAAYTVKGRLESSAGVPADVTMLDASEYALFQATTSTTPADTEFIVASVSATSLKKFTWSNIKSTLKAYFDPIYATPSTAITATLSTTWSGSGPYTQNVTISGMTSTKNGFAGLDPSATAPQREATRKAILSVTAQTTNSITVTADGEKPTVTIPIAVIMLA